MSNKFILIFVTCGSKKEAHKIADALLRKRLIACANIISGVKSVFRWKGRIDKAKEFLLILKTKRSNFKRVEKEVRRVHSYELPEIVALPIVAGNSDYLEWIKDSVE